MLRGQRLCSVSLAVIPGLPIPPESGGDTQIRVRRRARRLLSTAAAGRRLGLPACRRVPAVAGPRPTARAGRARCRPGAAPPAQPVRGQPRSRDRFARRQRASAHAPIRQLRRCALNQHQQIHGCGTWYLGQTGQHRGCQLFAQLSVDVGLRDYGVRSCFLLLIPRAAIALSQLVRALLEQIIDKLGDLDVAGVSLAKGKT